MSTTRALLEDGRTIDCLWLENWTIDDLGKQLGPYGFAVYITLRRFAENGQTCSPSQKKIAEYLGISKVQVRREIKKLEELGLVKVTLRQGEDGGSNSNLYTLIKPNLDEAKKENQ